MTVLTDLHCHTVASTHAYSTIKEYAQIASQKGLQAIAITDHAPGVTDGAHLYHFQNLHAVPRKINNVTILRGAECTMQDKDGNLDLPDSALSCLDIVIASMHQSQYAPQSKDEHTNLLMKVMDNPYVDIMGHIGREEMEFDIERVVKKAKKTKKLIEINSSSFHFRENIRKRCLQVVQACKKFNAPLVVTSDSHICYNIGNFDLSIKLLQEAGYDEKLIMNTSLEKILNYLNINI